MSAGAIALPRIGKMEALDRALLAVSAAAGLFYFISIPWHGSFPGMTVIKGLAISPLAVFAWRALPTTDGRILGISLAFSSLGDVLLNIGGMFVFGLSSFLVAHLLYIVIFVRNRRQPAQLMPVAGPVIAALAVYSTAMTLWLWPDLGDMKVPVAAYVATITAMGMTAALADFRAPWVLVGALLFILSDSVIAVGRFKDGLPGGAYIIWSTYYVGQILIALGFIKEKLGRG